MIDLFPERMLDGSIHTAILVGILVLWAMTETLGFVFAGFVVAGYLAALAIVAPMSAIAIGLEAVLTYGIVWWMGTGATSQGLWSRVFGRERFLLFIVVSIPVRILVEGLAAPGFELLLPAWEGERFFGIGIVLVPLLANTFWKPGLSKGLVQVSLGAGATWLVLRWVLMPLTNFQFSGFEITFEGIATDFLAAPKAYVILVLTCFVAARNSVRYGWDFGGILVPALLAIIALTPLKLLSTVVEIVLLVFVYRGFVALPGVRSLNLEGPRRIVSMYAVAYALKWAIAAVTLRVAPEVPVSDLYGFGYLLTSLVALKCWQKGNPVRILGALHLTIAQGLALSLAASLALSWMVPDRPRLVPAAPEAPPAEEVPIARSILLARSAVSPVPPADDRAFARTFGALVGGGTAAGFSGATDLFRGQGLEIGFATRDDGARCLAVRPPRPDARPPSGLPAAWWCGGDGPGLYVPSGDPDALWVAAWLAQTGRIGFVVLEGVDFTRLRASLGARPLVVLRTVRTGRSRLDPRSAEASRAAAAFGALSHVPVRFEGDHGTLQEVWEALAPTDALLTVSIAEVERLLPAPPPPARLDGLLSSVHARPEPLPTVTTASERVALAEVVLGTAMRMAREGYGGPASVAFLGRWFGIDVAPTEDGWLLDGGPTAWGTWLIRPGATGPWVVAAPFSTAERGTGPLAVALGRRLQAEAIWISGHGPTFGHDNALRSDVERLPFGPLALRRVLAPAATSTGPSARLLLVRMQPRVGPDTPPVVIARGAEMVAPVERDALQAALLEHLEDWPGLGFDDGGAATTMMGASGHFPVQYQNAMGEDAAAIAWYSPALLSEVPGTDLRTLRLGWYGDWRVPVEPIEVLVAEPEPPEVAPPAWARPLLRQHVENLDQASLQELRRRGEVRVLDAGTRLVTAVGGPGWVCTAVAGAPDQVRRFPLQGCWSAP